MKRHLADYAPPGAPLSTELTILFGCLILSALYSLRFPVHFFQVRADFLDPRVPIYGDGYMVFGRFENFLRETIPWLGYAMTALVMAGLAVWNYSYHHLGSKSVYLMRRLPDPWERHRRCLALPLLGIALGAVLCLLSLGLFAWLYREFAPVPNMYPLPTR